MPVQRIVMPDGSTKAFPERATKIDIQRAIDERLAQMESEGHLAGARQSRKTVVTQTSPISAAVPKLPPGESLDRNIQRMEKLRQETSISPWNFLIPLYGLARFGTEAEKRLADFKSLVQTHGPWDYKDKDLKAYEAGGNFNYGAAGAAAGIPDWLLYRAAGWYQEPNTGGKGVPWLIAPFGDDPRDQEQIKRGIEHYRNSRN